MSRSWCYATATIGRRRGPRIVFRSPASESGEQQGRREFPDGLHALARLHQQHQGDHGEADRQYGDSDDQQRLACGVGADYQCYPSSRHRSSVHSRPILRSRTNIRSMKLEKQLIVRKKYKIRILFSENKMLYPFAEQKPNYVLNQVN
jgi:hypothetical protein